MNPETLSRLGLTASLIAGGLSIYWIVNWLTLVRVIKQVNLFPSYQPGIPAIVYFTTPTCAPCKTIQRPAIEMLKNRLGEYLQVFEVDASKQTHLAKQWGVLSVPTTYIFDSNGKPRYVNHGVANAAKLIQQLEIEDFVI
jgi:thiol-disulfide isomerase/thioredoxin